MISLQYNPCLNKEEEIALRTAYRDSFPEDERRPEETIFGIRPAGLHLCTLHNNEQIIGLLTFWQLSSSTFVEHFFILPEYRSLGYGAKVLQQFLDEHKGLILLECEPPTTTIAERRIAFYTSLGFSRLSVDYKQPPYLSGGSYIDMYLMSTEDLGAKTIKAHIEEIYRCVYDIT